MKTVYVYDNVTGTRIGKLVAEFPKNIDGFEITRYYKKANETDVVETMKTADFAIGHFEDSANWDALLDGSPAGSVRIRTSRDGFEGQPSRITDEGVIALYLKPSHATTATKIEWQLILNQLCGPGVAESVALGRVPPELALYFLAHTFFLPALALLCQGYLAVHSDTNGLAEGVGARDAADVSRALDMMGWPTAVGSEKNRIRLCSALCDASPEGPEKRQALREQARDNEYWAPLANAVSSISNLATLKATEWDPLFEKSEEEKDTGWIQLQKLLDLLNETGTPGNESGIVARAYVELSANMGRSR